MNGTVVALGVAAAVSIFMISWAVFRNGSPATLSSSQPTSFILQDRSSLEDDLNDILAFIPLDDVKRIIHSYAAYDKQISETVRFINDMRNYIIKEFRKLPNTELFLNVLRQNGLQVQHWQDEILDFWNNIPPYVNEEADSSYGGLTSMISTIMDRIQKEELHALLCSKVRHSKNFPRFLRLLISQEFVEFYQAIEKSREMQRLFYWAKESDIEIIFAVELLTCLHSYLTTGLHQDTFVN